MGKPACVHIVDANHTRRAQIARRLYENRIHAEIYESLDELADRPPTDGAVLLSDELPASGVRELIATVRDEAGFMAVGMVSSRPSRRRIVQAMSSGALDFLEWPCPATELVSSVHRICTLGERKARTERPRAEARRLVGQLSRREREVLELLLAGASNKDIGRVLAISPRTVEIHRANAMSRLGAATVADAVRIGIYAGLDE